MLKFFITTSIILLTLFFSTSPVFAQDIGLTNTVNTIANQAGVKTEVAADAFLNTTIGGLLALILGLVGAIFLGLTIFSGFQWMTAGGNEEKVTQSRKRLVNATIGLGVIVLAFMISNAVFEVFYNVSGRPSTGLSSPAGLSCQTSEECPGNYVCENGQCVLLCQTDNDCCTAQNPPPCGLQCSIATGHCEVGWSQSSCENNSDCTDPNAPICFEFLFWQTCTCTDDDECPENNPYCVSTQNYQPPPDLNSGFHAVCVHCYNNDQCPGPGDPPANTECDNNTNTCVAP